MESVEHRRVAGLDLLRGAAVALVLIRHAWVPANGDSLGGTTGIVGVVVFFALSGYLITGLLVSDLQRFGRVRYGRFYRNRALRLLPALLLFLAVLTALSLTINPASDRAVLGRTLLTALTYTTNLPFNHGSTAIDHLWTLATEEQFYLIWPVVLWLGFRWRRLGAAVFATGSSIVAALVLTVVHQFPNETALYPLPISWALAMVIGAAGRLQADRVRGWLVHAGIGRAAVAAAVVLALLALLPEEKGSALTYLFVGPVAALAATVLVFGAEKWQGLPSSGWLPLLGLGRISYAAYLWNYAVVVWLGGMGQPFLIGLLGVAVTLTAAIISWYTVEQAAARTKLRLDKRARAAAPQQSLAAGAHSPR
ncbi:acyltransferase family protein [Amnibacterium kyonggiense]